jgi:hypothetical protein
MAIGNQQIWDQGIGEPATNMLMQSTGSGRTASNFNPGALGADPTPPAADPVAAPATPAAPAQAATPQQQGPNPKVKAAKDYLDQMMLKYNQAQQAISGMVGVPSLYQKHEGRSLDNWRRELFAAQQKYQQMLQQYGG